MRRAIKNPDSEIISKGLQYLAGNAANNKKIKEVLLVEQKMFCAYTDEFISRTDAADIEHFNPTLKGTALDNYQNWFLVKHQWNKEKSKKWEKFQPVLHPAAADFEERIIYDSGDYISNSSEDTEAINLISLLKLDDARLATNRKKYIARKRDDMKAYGQDAATFFDVLLNVYPMQISYPRAIKEEFGIDIWNTIK